jgi:hypothetical protein
MSAVSENLTAFEGFELDFSSRVQILKSLKSLGFEEVLGRINSIHSRINVVITAKQMHLNKNPELKTLACAFSDDAYCEKVVEILAEELPVIDPQEYLEDGNYYLMADIVGMNAWREEEVQELISDPENYGKDFSLTAFLELINYGIDDDEPWKNCIEYFNWPIVAHYAVKYGFDLDHNYIKKSLRKHGAPAEVYTMVMLTLFPPANDLLCITADDWECDPSCMDVEITTENIRLLRKQWKQAQKLIEQLEPAREWVAENPWFIPILGECLENSQNREKERVRVRV